MYKVKKNIAFLFVRMKVLGGFPFYHFILLVPPERRNILSAVGISSLCSPSRLQQGSVLISSYNDCNFMKNQQHYDYICSLNFVKNKAKHFEKNITESVFQSSLGRKHLFPKLKLLNLTL